MPPPLMTMDFLMMGLEFFSQSSRPGDLTVNIASPPILLAARRYP